MATHSVKVDEKGVRREPIGTVSAPCDEKVWRNMELQAKADGWVDLVWSGADVYHTLYGRRAVLVKTEPTRPAWLFEGEQVIFTTRAGEYSPEALQSRHDAVDKAVYAGWVALRWVDDRDSGLNHLVARKMSPPATIDELVARMTTPDARWLGGLIGGLIGVQLGIGGVRDHDGAPLIRSELGGLMGPGYQATGYEPPPRRKVLLDDPTGDDIAGDAP